MCAVLTFFFSSLSHTYKTCLETFSFSLCSQWFSGVDATDSPVACRQGEWWRREKKIDTVKEGRERLLGGRKEFGRVFYFFLRWRASCPALDFPTIWKATGVETSMIATATAGLVPARCGWWIRVTRWKDKKTADLNKWDKNVLHRLLNLKMNVLFLS